MKGIGYPEHAQVMAAWNRYAPHYLKIPMAMPWDLFRDALWQYRRHFSVVFADWGMLEEAIAALVAKAQTVGRGMLVLNARGDATTSPRVMVVCNGYGRRGDGVGTPAPPAFLVQECHEGDDAPIVVASHAYLIAVDVLVVP